jgi:hypothetical protein
MAPTEEITAERDALRAKVERLALFTLRAIAHLPVEHAERLAAALEADDLILTKE